MEIYRAILCSYVFSWIYILSSLPLTLSYRTTKVFNFAHPIFITYGAYVVIIVNEVLGREIPLAVAVFLAFVVGGLVSLISHLLVFKPLSYQRVSSNVYMVTSMGLWFIYQYVLYIVCQLLTRRYDVNFLSYSTIEYKDVRFLQDVLGLNSMPQYTITATLIGVSVGVALYILFNKTVLGLSLRGIADNASLVAICGVPINRLVNLTWFLVGGITALSGVIWVNFSGSTTPDLGLNIVVDNFAAAFIGGLYSLPITAVASIVLALIENMLLAVLNYYFGVQPTVRIAIVFGIVLAILVARPPMGAGGGLPYRFIKRVSRK
jgi:branched-subunit amino acid ABC-type transport system permease component